MFVIICVFEVFVKIKMSKRTYNLNNLEDIEELNRFAFVDEELNQSSGEEFGDSDDSETEDYIESRSTDSETDHEFSDVEEEDELLPQENCFIGK